jgi:hypothetical protein
MDGNRMSAETKAEMEAAIERHFSSECDGAMLQGWMLQAFGSNVDDIEYAGIRTLREFPETQNVITTMGLAEYAKVTVADQIVEVWDGDDEN